MNTNRLARYLIASTILLVLSIGLAQATDVVDSTVLAHDRVANVLVLTDKTVWPLELLTDALPEDLQAGDKVEIRYESNEDDGVKTIHSITRID